MNYKEMNNEDLMRYYICAKRELKNKQSEIYQIEQELNDRYDKGILVKEKNK